MCGPPVRNISSGLCRPACHDVGQDVYRDVFLGIQREACCSVVYLRFEHHLGDLNFETTHLDSSVLRFCTLRGYIREESYRDNSPCWSYGCGEKICEIPGWEEAHRTVRDKNIVVPVPVLAGMSASALGVPQHT